MVLTTKVEMITATFDLLNKCKIGFLTLRNFDLIPYGCSIESDIDVLVTRDMLDRLVDIMQGLGFRHLIDNDPKQRYLYNAEPHHHFLHRAIGVHFDVVTGLYYRSLDNESYVPVCKQLQNLILERKLSTHEVWRYQPSPEDEMIHICCHAIFDKNEVSKRYAKRMVELLAKCDQHSLLEGLQMVFYKFAPVLVKKIKENDVRSLFEAYIRFSDY